MVRAPAGLDCRWSWPVRLSWARLLERVVEIGLEHCPICGGELKLIAAIRVVRVIGRTVERLGLSPRAWCEEPIRKAACLRADWVPRPATCCAATRCSTP